VCPQQQQFEPFVAPAGSTVYVSDRVSVRTEGTQRVISVHGVVFAHYDLADRVAEAYAMIMLCESGYATQLQVARSFGYSARSLRRDQERFEAGGVSSLARAGGRPAGTRIPSRKERGRDQSILHLKKQGWSNRGIAGRLGVSEKAIRKRLHRLGWQPTAQPSLPPRAASRR
jgi:DNA-binding NarL/FixJ family response regulator